MKGLPVETVIAHIVARTTPFTLGDARLLVELAREAKEALFAKGVVCRWGGEGTHKGANVCIPSRWDGGTLARRKRTCRHCPVLSEIHRQRRAG